MGRHRRIIKRPSLDFEELANYKNTQKCTMKSQQLKFTSFYNLHYTRNKIMFLARFSKLVGHTQKIFLFNFFLSFYCDFY